jgi:hypothetical protein
MAGVSSIDKLPEIERQRVLKALTEAGPEPDYRGIVAKLKLPCSHMALWRYHHAKVIPALKRNAKAILAAPKAMDNTNTHGAAQTQESDLKREAQSVTIQALTDDPIVSAVIAKRSRLDRVIEKTLDAGQFDTYAKLESVDLKAIEMHAKAMQHPGFSAAAQQTTTNNTVVVVLPTANDARMQAWQQRQAIDIEPVE